MPNPKTGTVTVDVAKAVLETKAGKVEFRVDKTGIIHASGWQDKFFGDQARGKRFHSDHRRPQSQAIGREGQVCEERHHLFHDGPRYLSGCGGVVGEGRRFPRISTVRLT